MDLMGKLDYNIFLHYSKEENIIRDKIFISIKF